MSEVTLRFYNLDVEGPEPIFSLFERVYGDSIAIRQRWQWEWQQHPEADRIKIVVAEADHQFIGMTVRMPIQLSCAGHVVDGWFATNSMVDPEFRGQGVIHKLYEMANSIDGIQLSKGTTEGMFRQLLKMGYERIQPDTYQVCLLAPWLWFKQKIGLGATVKAVPQNKAVDDFVDYRQVKTFPDELDSLFMSGMVAPLKNVAWLNWRYVNIPHKQYQFAIREKDGQVVSWCVIRVQGGTGYLVDLRYSDEQQDEPMYTIRYAKRVAKASGAIKMVAWGIELDFRKCLTMSVFLKRNATPYFSCTDVGGSFSLTGSLFFVQGDGDSDYL